MNILLLSALCLCGLATLVGSVTVQDGDFFYPLESVKKLKDLQESGMKTQKAQGYGVYLCDHPDFPKDLESMCTRSDAAQAFQRIGAIAVDSHTCEICAFAACAGC
ncbi:guanylin [Trichosurus vulpecula]|uniref:guanylin n=1 Tax=Trichosurus vulpecula TaxID=9337 RepID=UPI00186AFB40|nr:guanylin [Trichosurus vulpecula]